MEIFKLVAIVLIIAILMWRKVDLGLSLLIGSVLTGFLFGMNYIQIAHSSMLSIIDPDTVKLLIVVYLILGMGRFMSAHGSIEDMVDALEKIIHDRRIAMIIPPALIGLLPTPGGAMLSAPMVDESGTKLKINPDQKTFVNFWFRHLWEYCWPLYPGLIVAGAILKVPIPNMMKVQYPLSIAAIIAGVIFGLLPIRNGRIIGSKKENIISTLYKFNRSIWAIWLILIGLMVFKLDILIILSIIFIIIFMTTEGSLGKRWNIFKKALSWKIALLLLSVMIFKGIIMGSSAIQVVPTIFESSGISPIFLLFLIPFVIGLLTGVNQAYVGVGFPLLLPFFGNEVIDLKLVMFAYATGFFGVLLSPVHLCLLLTKEYFGANWSGIYKQLLPATLFVFIVSVILLYI